MTDHETHDVQVRAGDDVIAGLLTVPAGARGIVLFAHGSGSGRFSRRNNAVARVLNDGGMATLLVDLLTAREEAIDARTGHLRFDIEFLTARLLAATEWLESSPETEGLAVGYFGASTGAAAALMAAASHREIFAVVSRGGRPDLARDCLARVRAPTLLIVGGDDVPVIPLNQEAYDLLVCEKQMVIIPGATHLFEEPGALEEVARLATEWFVAHAPHVTTEERR